MLGKSRNAMIWMFTFAWIWNLALVTIFCVCTVPLTQIGFIFLLILCIMHHVLQVSPKSSPPIRGIKFRWSQRSQLSQRNQRSQRSGAAWVWLSGSELVGGDWNMTFIFPEILGIIMPIDSYFSEGLKPPTSYITTSLFSLTGNHCFL